MNHPWLRLCTLFVLAVSTAQAQIPAATAESLMRSSGLWEQLASVAPQVRAGLAQGLAQRGAAALDAADARRLQQLAEQVYAADRLRATAQATIQQGLKPAQLPELQRWFASGTGRQVARMEEAASATQTDPQAVVQQGGQLLEQTAPDRRALLQELVTVTRAPDFMVQMTFSTALAVFRGINQARADPNAPPEGSVVAALEEQRPQLLQAFGVLSLTGFALAYRDLPTADLVQYLAFLKTEAGSDYTELGMQAFDAAMAAGAQALGQGLPVPAGRLGT